MNNLYTRGDRYWLDFRFEGRRYREACPRGIKESDAKQYLAKRMREVALKNIYEAPPERIAFAAFADDFLKTDSPTKKSKDRDESVVEMLKSRWTGMDLGAITPKMIEDYKALRLKVRKPATVAREIQVLKRLFKKAAEWGKVKFSPAVTVQKPRVNNGRVRFLETAELKRLMLALPDWLQPIVTFARFTGARRGEILRLTWNDVDFKRGLLTFRDTKAGGDGTVAMNRTTRSLLESLPTPIDRGQLVFQLENQPVSWIRIARAWRAACTTAKITDFHFHDVRHQAATDLISCGATLYDVQGFLRHRSTTMTARYAHLTETRREATSLLLDGVDTKAATGEGQGR